MLGCPAQFLQLMGELFSVQALVRSRRGILATIQRQISENRIEEFESFLLRQLVWMFPAKIPELQKSPRFAAHGRRSLAGRVAVRATFTRLPQPLALVFSAGRCAGAVLCRFQLSSRDPYFHWGVRDDVLRPQRLRKLLAAAAQPIDPLL